MLEQEYKDPCHFKGGFDPKCPKCGSTDLKVSLSEDLWGVNGQYEVIYCAEKTCRTFLSAFPVVIQNLLKSIKLEDKI
ncbi:MAG: hypothetical protein V4732_04440 [Pseudomonadota bacterium]